MKRFVVSVIILTVIIFSSATSVCYLKQATDLMTKKVDQINIKIKEDDIGSALIEVKNLQNLWEEKKDIFVIFVNNNNIDDITLSLSKLAPLLKYKDKSEFCSNLNYTKTLISNMYENDSVSLSNII